MEKLSPLDELGVYLLGGRIKDPARAMDEAVEAERIGLTSAWIAERFDMKELGVHAGCNLSTNFWRSIVAWFGPRIMGY
jgi:alkanesulfonate monooxygenase SsuD/methylene tetrahydromethanopterin reductase-like flavin-dependent oxidoreductase (luciferase family)